MRTGLLGPLLVTPGPLVNWSHLKLHFLDATKFMPASLEPEPQSQSSCAISVAVGSLQPTPNLRNVELF